jgi:hypothetical protein
MEGNENEGSHLFLVRLWPKSKEANGRAEGEWCWCGRVQHVLSGEAHNFRDWPGLIDLLLTMMPTLDTVQQHRQETEDEP